VRRPALSGWRRAMRVASLGLIRPGPSARERRRIEQARQARTPIQGRCALVAVLSRKGGVGKSTVTALLASTFGLLRAGADAVVALDAATEVGNLADRLVVDGVRLTTHDLARAGEVEGRADISRYTVRDPQARLEVVAAPPEGEAILAEGKRSGSWGCWRGPTTWSWLTRGATRAEPATALALRSAFDPEARLARSRAERAGQEAGARPEGIWPSRVDSLSDPALDGFIVYVVDLTGLGLACGRR
jgi:hypothetical protein